MLVGNYRPASLLLLTILKIYKTLMQSRIMNFFVEKNALFEMQYGVQQGRSWEHALLNAENTSLNSLNRRQIYILLY